MDQRRIIAYLALKRPPAPAIPEDLTAYHSVTRYIREEHLLSLSQDAPSADVHRGINDADQALRFALGGRTFPSVRQLSQLTHRPLTTVYRRLTELLGFTARHLQWVPHALSNVQNARRADLSRELLRMLEVQCGRARHDIVTLDESWFCLSTNQ